MGINRPIRQCLVKVVNARVVEGRNRNGTAGGSAAGHVIRNGVKVKRPCSNLVKVIIDRVGPSGEAVRQIGRDKRVSTTDMGLWIVSVVNRGVVVSAVLVD